MAPPKTTVDDCVLDKMVIYIASDTRSSTVSGTAAAHSRVRQILTLDYGRYHLGFITCISRYNS